MSRLREAALAALKELDYIEQTGDISTGSHIDVAQKLHAALAGEPKIGEPGVKIWEPQNEVEKGFYLAGWRRCAEGQGETQHCALLEAAVLAEREACAQICDENARYWASCPDRRAAEGSRICGEEIRARGNT